MLSRGQVAERVGLKYNLLWPRNAASADNPRKRPTLYLFSSSTPVYFITGHLCLVQFADAALVPSTIPL